MEKFFFTKIRIRNFTYGKDGKIKKNKMNQIKSKLKYGNGIKILQSRKDYCRNEVWQRKDLDGIYRMLLKNFLKNIFLKTIFLSLFTEI